MAYITIRLSQRQVLQLIEGQSITINISSAIPEVMSVDMLHMDNGPFHVSSGITFLQFFNKQILQLAENGCHRTTETYRSAYHKFACFRMQQDLTFDAIDSQLLVSFQSYLRQQNLSMNTISFYMRILRSVYHKAVEQGLAVDCQPFSHVYTGQAKTDKRAIGIEELRKIRALDLQDRRLQFARDLFLFSVYTRGMSFVDIAYLKQGDIRNGILTYKRRKTGQMLNICWEEAMQEIVDRYQKQHGGTYLLPIINKENGKERNQYRHVQTQVNKHLKTIAEMAGMSTKLTMYCARHSWATIARQLQIPMEVISHGMGHTHERTTEIYLKSIDIESIDQANRRIICLLQQDEQE